MKELFNNLTSLIANRKDINISLENTNTNTSGLPTEYTEINLLKSTSEADLVKLIELEKSKGFTPYKDIKLTSIDDRYKRFMYHQLMVK